MHQRLALALSWLYDNLALLFEDSNNNHIRKGSSESFGFGFAHTSCV
jgi:hypothetical protein